MTHIIILLAIEAEQYFKTIVSELNSCAEAQINSSVMPEFLNVCPISFMEKETPHLISSEVICFLVLCCIEIKGDELW